MSTRARTRSLLAARATGRGWRLDKSSRGAQIDAVIALCMAVERAQYKPEPVRLLGWA
jgi:hypothetical protein